MIADPTTDPGYYLLYLYTYNVDHKSVFFLQAIYLQECR